MFVRLAILTLLPFVLATATLGAEEVKTINLDGKTFKLAETGNHTGGEFARYILPGEDAEKYTIKLGTLLNTNAVNNDPIDTAKAAMQSLQSNPALVNMEIRVNRSAPAAILIFGFKFPDGEFQLNVWKYEKRLYGIFCNQIMVAAPQGSDSTTFKMWADTQKEKLVQQVAGVHWPPTPNQSLFE